MRSLEQHREDRFILCRLEREIHDLRRNAGKENVFYIRGLSMGEAESLNHQHMRVHLDVPSLSFSVQCWPSRVGTATSQVACSPPGVTRC